MWLRRNTKDCEGSAASHHGVMRSFDQSYKKRTSIREDYTFTLALEAVTVARLRLC